MGADLRTYSYDKAKARGQELGLKWSDELANSADVLFTRLNLTQAEVDQLTVFHADVTHWMFSPSSYRWYQRIGLAFHFLFGRK